MITLQEEVNRYKLDIPRMCNLERMMLRWRTKGSCKYRMAWAGDRASLTDGYPHQERCWEVSDLEGVSAGAMPGVEDTHK